MGKLYSYIYMSLDGVVASPEKWTAPYFSEDLNSDLATRLERSAGMVLGRRTYDEFSAFWPNQPEDAPFVALNNTVQKFVVSDSLGEAKWQNSSVVRGSEVADLKKSVDGDLHITGSPTLVRNLIAQDLLDEVHLVTFPIFLGTGQRMFEGSSPVSHLRLVDSTAMDQNVLHLTYSTSN